MSKGSLFWANASGKLGESVFYRSGGEQRNRTYVKNIKNPKTEGQMRNRIQLANWAAMYRRLKPILSKTFTARSAAESGFNALVKANKARLRYAITKEMLEECDYIPLGARVSSGTIVCNVEPKQIALSNPEESGTPPKYYISLVETGDAVINRPLADDALDGLNGGQIYQIMTANGNQSQLPSEFKVVVLYGSWDIDDETGEYTVGGGLPLSYRVYTCSADSTDEGTFVGNTAFASSTMLRPISEEIERSTSPEIKSVHTTGLMLGGALTASEMSYDCFGMIIYYENSEGKNANNTFVYGMPDAISAAQDFSEGGDVFNEILADSGYSASDALSSASKVTKASLSPYEIALVESSSDGGSEEEEA